MDKPFSPACDENKQPILQQLLRLFAHCGQVLEIGSGTGQHGVHFASNMPWLNWQPSDQAELEAGDQVHDDPLGEKEDQQCAQQGAVDRLAGCTGRGECGHVSGHLKLVGITSLDA